VYGSGQFQLGSLAGFSGFEEIRMINYSNSSQQLFLRADEIANVSTTGSGQKYIYLGTGQTTLAGGEGTDYVYANAVPSSGNVRSWNDGNVLDGGSGFDYLTIGGSSSGTTDLRSSTVKNFEYLYIYDGKVVVDAEQMDSVSYVWGNSTSKMSTFDEVLDLRDMNVQQVSVISENATGTTFKVNSLATAFQIVGGSGADTIEASGFTFTADQREAIFSGSIEAISDGSGIYGNGGSNSLQAFATGSELFGGAGNDFLISDVGNDVMTGGSDSDTFTFAATSGQDLIKDFQGLGAANGDQIDLSALAGEIDSYNDLVANNLEDVSGSAVIAWGDNKIVLESVLKADLHADDFLF
ncbi:hypothetical protein ACOI1H_25525, partial [Loktanella sp. DJP18]